MVYDYLNLLCGLTITMLLYVCNCLDELVLNILSSQKTDCYYVRLVTFKQGLIVLSARLTVYLEPSMVNSVHVVQ